jgi:hypothetical protein
LQWLQYPSGINGDNLNNAGRDTRKYFMNRKREYFNDIMMRLQRTVRTRTLETCIEEQMNLGGITDIEVT